MQNVTFPTSLIGNNILGTWISVPTNSTFEVYEADETNVLYKSSEGYHIDTREDFEAKAMRNYIRKAI